MILLVAILATGLQGCMQFAPVRSGQPQALNMVVASAALLTSGQPSTQQLEALTPGQFALVINLAPTTGLESLPGEARILGKRGISYLSIPVDLRAPQEKDFKLFSATLSAAEKPVWVHCGSNQRASLFTFLFRVIYLGADPDAAYDQVTEVWVPPENWIFFANGLLARHGSDFRL